LKVTTNGAAATALSAANRRIPDFSRIIVPVAYPSYNVPLAVVLWRGGISFGGVVAFIFADLIIAPILNIYRKYYGRRMALFLFATFYAAMAGRVRD
jgi:uncharacterized membrane protein YraQ (UPF0718 family)